MKPKKICEKSGCNRLAFGKFCNLHRPQTIRKTKQSLKQKRLQPRKKTDKEKAEKKKSTEEMWNFFLEIWNERPHRCEVSGVYLSDPPLSTYFHHLLPKRDSQFPQYKLCKWNIALLHPEIHSTVEQNIDLVPQIKQRYLDLLQAHRNGLLDNY